MRRQEKRREDKGTSWIACIGNVFRGGAVAGASVVLLLWVFAIFIAGGVLAERWSEPAILTSCLFGGVIGGSWAVKGVSMGRGVIGIGTGMVLFLILLIAGMMVYGTDCFGQGGERILAACLCGGALAGFTRRKGKRSTKRKKGKG